MRLSGNQLERLAERVFKVLSVSGYVEIDSSEDPQADDRVYDAILKVLEDDSRMEDRLSREAERLVGQQSHIAKKSNRPMVQLVEEVKARLAKSKRVIIDESPDRADLLAEKIMGLLWKLDVIDFFASDRKVQNCMAHAIYRFKHENDSLLDAVEKVVNRKCDSDPYSHAWCQLFDKYFAEVQNRLNKQNDGEPEAGIEPEAGTEESSVSSES